MVNLNGHTYTHTYISSKKISSLRHRVNAIVVNTILLREFVGEKNIALQL